MKEHKENQNKVYAGSCYARLLVDGIQKEMNEKLHLQEHRTKTQEPSIFEEKRSGIEQTLISFISQMKLFRNTFPLLSCLLIWDLTPR